MPHLPPMPPWLLVLLAGIFTQIVKFMLYGAANRELSLRVLVTTNGLPSLYAVSFACLTTMVGMVRGARSPEFTVCFIFAGIVLHDLVRVQGSVAQGGRTALLLARSLGNGGDGGENPWIQQLLPLLGDRRHRPLHITLGVVLGILLGLTWRPVLP